MTGPLDERSFADRVRSVPAAAAGSGGERRERAGCSDGGAAAVPVVPPCRREWSVVVSVSLCVRARTRGKSESIRDSQRASERGTRGRTQADGRRTQAASGAAVSAGTGTR